ncbi:MAG TPA: hypothetical protein GX700_08785 [Paracoccus sp.]|nr:hypothetical protein [Paracoccus sp. (in: a-proteobacteria)]
MQLAPGDIVAIETETGPALVQVTHTHVSYPEVLRVLGEGAGSVADPAGLALAPTRAIAMAPLGEMLASGRLEGRVLGRAPLPADARTFPLFKMPILDKIEGRRENVAYWWLWDGDGLRFSTAPDHEFDRVPLREVLGAERLLALLADLPARR